jgi:hypothetical protein
MIGLGILMIIGGSSSPPLAARIRSWTILTEWQDFHAYKLDMDQVIKLKDKKISSLEVEISKSKQKSFVTTI